MRTNEQLAQASKRLVAERLHRLQSYPRKASATRADARLENPLGVLGGRTVEACRKALRERAGSRVGSGPLPDAAEKLATGAQENGLQHLCASSARSFSPSTRDGSFAGPCQQTPGLLSRRSPALPSSRR